MTPMEPQRARGGRSFRLEGFGSRVAWITLSIPALLLVIAMVLPNFISFHPPATKNACIYNPRQISAAKEQWALENKKNPGDPIDIPAVNQNIKGRSTPVCPEGGTYSYNVAGTVPTCTVPGHSL